jgi:hypothetical protein
MLERVIHAWDACRDCMPGDGSRSLCRLVKPTGAGKRAAKRRCAGPSFGRPPSPERKKAARCGPASLSKDHKNQEPEPRGGVICGRPLGKRFVSATNGWRPSVICPACWRGPRSAGPDEVRRPSAPDQGCELWAPDPWRSVRWSSIVTPCRSSRGRRARQTREPVSSLECGASIGLRP